MLRLLLVVSLAVAALATALPTAAPASAATGCPAGGAPPPPRAVQRQVDDLDGDGLPDALWIANARGTDGATHRFVGVSTASGAISDVEITTASPIPLRALAIDAQRDGNHQIIVSDGRGAYLYEFADCRIQTVVDTHGAPFLFDLQNRRDTGTGVGCADLGAGPHLVGLQALPQDSQWTIRRTEIDLDGTVARIGRSDTVTAGSAQDPAVVAAQTIT
ncbi:MAG: hypothetical protein ACRDTK_07500, partial [Mycobacterium sp.]